MLKNHHSWIALAVGAVALVAGCVHQPPPEPCPIEGVDSSPSAICDPDVVYFAQDVQPILRTKCGIATCHDNVTAEEDIRLVDYNTVNQSIDLNPCDPKNSELLEVIRKSGEEHMPPYDKTQLTEAEIATLEKWIEQGAQNFMCMDDCDTTTVTFSGSIMPLVNGNCIGCHSGTSPSGNLALTNYAEISAAQANNRLYGALTATGYVAMPPTGPLSDCRLDLVRIWIRDGMQNN